VRAHKFFERDGHDLHCQIPVSIAQAALGAEILIPTLEGETRVRKPPLTAWVTALGVRPETVDALDQRDQAARDAAFDELAFEARLPSLIASCLMLLAIYVLGRTVLSSPAGGLLSMAMAGTTLYFLRFGRQATTDVQLSLWVACASAFLALALLDNRRWLGFVGAGIAVGLAIMSKGPVVLAQSLLPAILFVAWRCRGGRHGAAPGGSSRRFIAPLLIGTLLALIVGLGWFAFVALRVPDVLSLWQIEVLRTDAVEKGTSHWYSYVSIFGMLMPWTPFVIGGAVMAVQGIMANPEHTENRRAGTDATSPADRLVFVLLLVVVPLVLMSFFRDRKVRYLLPLAGPCAVLGARCVLEFLRSAIPTRTDRFLFWLQVGLLAVVTVGVPLVGMTTWINSMRTHPDHRAWFSPALSISAMGAGVAIILLAILLRTRWRGGIILATVILMLCGQALFMYGYAQGYEGKSEMKPLADALWAQYPNVTPYNIRDGRKRIPPDLGIYLNRVIVWVDRFEQIPPPTDTAQLYIAKWDGPGREAVPQAAPGWHFFMRFPRDQEWWIAFVREPASAS
jgi:4-amino-4-deoxy-L-arabinose transferase-like glycosyltransferase